MAVNRQHQVATREKERLLRKPFSTEMLPRHRQLIEDALEIEQEEARAAGALGYMASHAGASHLAPHRPEATGRHALQP